MAESILPLLLTMILIFGVALGVWRMVSYKPACGELDAKPELSEDTERRAA